MKGMIGNMSAPLSGALNDNIKPHTAFIFYHNVAFFAAVMQSRPRRSFCVRTPKLKRTPSFAGIFLFHQLGLQSICKYFQNNPVFFLFTGEAKDGNVNSQRS